MRRLSSNSRKNQIYKAFREVGRVMRTVALLRFLADSGLRARVTAATNKAEAYNGFSAWTPVRQPGRDRRDDPAEQEKSVKWNSLLCNLIVFHIAIDMMEVIRQLVAEGWQVTAEDLAQLSPYLTSQGTVTQQRVGLAPPPCRATLEGRESSIAHAARASVSETRASHVRARADLNVLGGLVPPP